MAFDPDAYLAQGSSAAPAKAFDPDAYLATSPTAEVLPPAKEEQTGARNTFNQAAQGALDQGFYAGVEGAGRLAANTIPVVENKWLRAGLRVLSPGIPVAQSPAEQQGLTDYADAAGETRKQVREAFPVDEDFAQKLSGQIVAGLGQGLGTLPTYVIPGLGPALSVGGIYQEGYDDARQSGASADDAHAAALAYVPASALDVLGDKLLIGRILKPLKGKITVGQIAKHALASTGSEGITEGAQQMWLNAVAKIRGYDPERRLDDQVLQSLIVGAVSGGTLTALGGLASKALAPKQAKAETGPLPTEPTLGEEGTPLTEDPLATIPTAPPAPIQAPVSAGGAVPQGNPASVALPKGINSGITVANIPQTDPYIVRNRKRQQVSALGFPTDSLAKMNDLELDAVIADGQRYVAPARGSATVLGARASIILDAVRAQREQQAQRQAFEQGQEMPAPANEAEPWMDDPIVAEEEAVLAEEDIPFSAQPSTPEQIEHARLRWTMEQQLEAVGEQSPPIVLVVDNADQIPPQLAGETVRRAVQTGSIYEAYFLLTRRRDGSLIRRIVLIRDGAQRVAEMRGMSLDERVRQLALHEIVHHYGNLGALFTGAPEQYQRIVDGVNKRLRKENPELYRHLTNSREDGGYGYAPATPAGQMQIAEEYLARFNENTTEAPDWLTQTYAQIRAILRQLYPDLAWTDADVRTLLNQAQRRAANPELQRSIGATSTTPSVQFSAQPTQEQAEEAGRNPEKRRQFMESVAASPAMPPIATALEAWYRPLTDAAAVEQAKARINEIDIDPALLEIMSIPSGQPPTPAQVTLGIELLSRLNALQRYEDSVTLAEKLSEVLTTAGQAVQKAHLLSKLTPEGIDISIQRIIQRAVRDAGTEDIKDTADMIRQLKAELANSKRRNGTAAILDIARIIDESTELTPEQKATLMQKLRTALEAAARGEDAAAIAKLTQLALDAGLTRDQATRMARRALATFKKLQQTSRGKLLREMLRASIAKVGRAQMPKSTLEKWLAMNAEGMLDDDTLFAGIAAKWGLPVFTKAHAEKIKTLQRAYDAAPVGDLKLAAAADLLTAVHNLVPTKLWPKVGFFRQLMAVLNPKSVLRNLGGNQFLALVNVPIDAIGNVTDATASVVFKRNRTRKGLALWERAKGFATPFLDFKVGYDHALSQGQTQDLWKAGIKHVIDMARLTSRGTFDTADISGNYGTIFSNRFLKMLENTYTLLAGSTDRAFFRSAERASVERQMRAIEANTGVRPEVPPPEVLAQAHMDAMAAIFQDDNIASDALKKVQKLLNGSKRDPKTGKLTIPREFGLGNVVAMFTQVPGSLLMRGLEMSPIALVRGVYDSRHAIFKRDGFDAVAFNDAIGRSAVGGGIILIGYWLAKAGILSALPEEDRDREAMRKESGGGQYRINASALKRALMSGDFGPQTMMGAAEDGDVIYDFAWAQPVAIPLALGAQIAAQEAGVARAEAAGHTVNRSLGMLRVLLAAPQTLESQPMVSGIIKFFGTAAQRATAQNPTGGAVDAIYEAATQDLVSGFIPTAIRQLTQFNDNTVRETRATPFLGIAANLPGVSEQFPPRYNLLGEMQERYQYGTNTLWNVFASPVFRTQFRADPVLREMDALYERTGDPGVTLRQSPRSVIVNGRNLELTNEQRSEYARVSGTLSTSLLRELIASPQYALLPDDTKAKLAAARISAAGTAGKVLLFGHRPDHPPADLRRALQHARALNVTQPRQ